MKWRPRRTTYIVVGCLSVLSGLFLARFTEPLAIGWVFAGLVLLPLMLRHPLVRMVCIVFICFMVGWWRGGLLQVQNQLYYEYFNQKVTLQARSTEDGSYNDRGQLEFSANRIQLADGTALPGKIRVSGYGVGQVYRHDIVEVTGKLFPSRGGKQASMSFADIDIVARADSRIEDARREFIAGTQTALPEPAASLGIGLLVGERSLLPDDTATALTAAGLTHIVAVSGYNLMIIVHAVRRGLRRLSRFQQLAIIGFLIYGFLLVTGFSPSIVRASIVSGLGLVAWYFGRQFRPLLLICFVAALTAMANPYYVWGDIGWYLSFLAFAGVLILAPLLANKIFGQKESILPFQVANESFSAQLMTMPLIIFIFGRVSLVGLISNIVIVPMVPLAMLLTFIAGIAGALIPAVSGWIALPARIVLDVMLWLASWFAGLPHATTQVAVGIAGMLVLYAAIVSIIVGLRKHAQSVTIESS